MDVRLPYVVRLVDFSDYGQITSVVVSQAGEIVLDE